jgi:putative tricarboxylic transport membrane protein
MLSAWRNKAAPQAPGGEAAMHVPRGDDAAQIGDAPPPIDDWWGFAQVALALLSFALLVDAAGFVIAEGALFAVTASAFGSRRHHVDAGVGLAVAGAAFVVFTYGLGLNLPSGALWRYVLGPGGGL